ncbi:hypothetical protein [Desulforhopalus sp. IMCC35007]|uniref:hypothetical protein n=1 Tax=Desulforhopalus sp. IMCC35007 TaxID=2569543 RepID=UPI0010AEE0D0|nr:hypothetical protein [Desulforhopalus sp. IMCC35007]TKB06376.1 hypothetical protein FCL48_21160 [Desulforhopalus sp. IMCC35007]
MLNPIPSGMSPYLALNQSPEKRAILKNGEYRYEIFSENSLDCATCLWAAARCICSKSGISPDTTSMGATLGGASVFSGRLPTSTGTKFSSTTMHALFHTIELTIALSDGAGMVTSRTAFWAMGQSFY